MYSQFPAVGVQVTGDQFHGRGLPVRALQQDVLHNHSPNNISLVGAPRMGKTSLARHVFSNDHRLDDGSLNACVIIDISSLGSPNETFNEICQGIRGVVEEHDELSLSPRVDRILTRIDSQAGAPWRETCKNIEALLRELLQLENPIRIIVVLDEFDYAGEAFGNEVQALMRLRTMMSSGEQRLSLVTLSRQAIADIVDVHFPGSDFGNVMKEMILGPWTDEETASFVGKIEASVGRSVPKRVVGKVAGNHPYFLSVLAHELEGAVVAGDLDPQNTAIAATRLQSGRQFSAYLDKWTSDGWIADALELLFGAESSVEPIRRNRLLSLGLLRAGMGQGAESRTEAFCRDFGDAMNSYLRNRLYGDVVGAIRSELIAHLEPFVDKLVVSRPELVALLRDRCAAEREFAGSRSSDDEGIALDHALLPELIELLNVIDQRSGSDMPDELQGRVERVASPQRLFSVQGRRDAEAIALQSDLSHYLAQFSENR